jgi:hypothetical protein
MGVEYNTLWKECESRNASQREEIRMGWGNIFRKSSFVHEEQVERKEESLELVLPWRVSSRESWSVLGSYWS